MAGTASVTGARNGDLQLLHTSYGSSCNVLSGQISPSMIQIGILDTDWRCSGSLHSTRKHHGLLSSRHSFLVSNTGLSSGNNHGDAGCTSARPQKETGNQVQDYQLMTVERTILRHFHYGIEAAEKGAATVTKPAATDCTHFLRHCRPH